jgi:RHS repeat-associated protein
LSISGRLLSWDQADRNVSVTQAGVTVSYVRDTEGRVRLRVGGGDDFRFGFEGPGDSPAFQRTENATLVESMVSLPGGVLLSKRPNAVDDLWSFPNLHGDVMINTNNSGVLQGGLRFYSPDGVNLTVTNPTVVGGGSYGWLGSPQRLTELNGDLIQMGARPYLASIGRFLSTDSVEAGSCNDYDYVCGDPVNFDDLSGLCAIGASAGGCDVGYDWAIFTGGTGGFFAISLGSSAEIAAFRAAIILLFGGLVAELITLNEQRIREGQRPIVPAQLQVQRSHQFGARLFLFVARRGPMARLVESANIMNGTIPTAILRFTTTREIIKDQRIQELAA